METLHAEAEAVHPHLQKTHQIAAVHCAGVGFHSDLGPFSNGEVLAAGVQDLAQKGEGQHCWRAAPHVDGIHFQRTLLADPSHLRLQSTHILLEEMNQARVGVKVTIGAFGPAKGNVDVKADGVHWLFR